MNPLIPSALTLAQRLITIRCEVFGDGQTGILAISNRLGLPDRTWINYEAGVNMPASVMIQFLVLTNANPSWLLQGTGDMFLAVDLADRMIRDFDSSPPGQ